MRARKPKETCSPFSPYPWEWVEFWKMDDGAWRPIPKDAKISFWRATRWGKYYTIAAVQKIKVDTPFVKVGK